MPPDEASRDMTMLFVGGSQRSGTSIIQQLLCQLPDANPYVYEASFLRQLVACYTDARNSFTNNHSSYFGDIQQLRDFCSGVTHAFLEQTAARLGRPKHLILKEPHLTMYWPFLFELVPEAVFLLVVRDPRDVIASMVRVGEKQRALGQRGMFADRNVDQLCRHFLSFYQPSFEYKRGEFRGRLGIVQYEDLISDPQSSLKDISRFTGIPFDSIDPECQPDTGHVQQNVISGSSHYSPWMTAVTGEKLSRSRVGRFTDTLTPAEISQVEECCAEFFDSFGYHRSAA